MVAGTASPDHGRDMTDHRPTSLPPVAPSVAAPKPFVDRRRTFRREGDRVAHEETRLLARALDVLAADLPPEARLAGVLDLLSETVGAERAAVLADGSERRVAVAASGPDDEPAARTLALWLDAAAPRSRARRAASGPASVSVVTGRDRRRAAIEAAFGLLAVPTAGDVTLGFAFSAPIPDGTLAQRLPPAMARHAAVALSLVTDALAKERELAALRAGETERERYVSTVAHELRTPLTGLSGYLDLILDGRVGDPAIEREFLERGRTIVGSMAGLVGDLLEMSRLDAGSLALDIASFSVAEAMTTVAASLHPIALERGVDLRISPPPRLRSASGDRRRVEQILTNLTANALKFGRRDGVVELASVTDGSVALVLVRDDGAGIEPEDRPRIFERFYRMAGHEAVAGTGLGLPIARELARAMGGDLDVASLPGSGSTFLLALPTDATPQGSTGLVRAVLDRALALERDRLETAADLRTVRAARGPVADRRAPRLGTRLSAARARP